MEGYDQATYGNNIADVYDDLYSEIFDVEGAVRFLSAVADGGKALELGIGTGRIALPLKATGVTVSGIDTSEQMVSKLRDKPGGDEIEVTMGDFTEASVGATFAVVYVVFNTIFGPTSQDAQIRCFANAERHLQEGGVFVIEAFVSDVCRFDRRQRVQASNMKLRSIHLEASVHEPMHQTIDTHHIVVSEEGLRIYPVRLRYAWPAELDLMARLAGLRLRERTSDWRGGAFTSASTSHISVYERA